MRAVPYLRRIDAGFSPWRAGFNPVCPCEIHDGRNATGAGFLPRFFCLPLLIIVAKLLHTRRSKSLPHEVHDSPNQAAH
jgi:hypothetical protein